MAGAEDRHVTISLNIALALKTHLHGSSWRTFMSDMKLHAESANSCFYPDVFVTCSDADRASKLVKREPTLVVEVLSNSTAAHDCGAKFTHYPPDADAARDRADRPRHASRRHRLTRTDPAHHCGSPAPARQTDQCPQGALTLCHSEL